MFPLVCCHWSRTTFILLRVKENSSVRQRIHEHNFGLQQRFVNISHRSGLSTTQCRWTYAQIQFFPGIRMVQPLRRWQRKYDTYLDVFIQRLAGPLLELPHVAFPSLDCFGRLRDRLRSKAKYRGGLYSPKL